MELFYEHEVCLTACGEFRVGFVPGDRTIQCYFLDPLYNCCYPARNYCEATPTF